MANRKQLYKYRGNRCSHCGMHVKEMVARYGTFNRMFEFHHINPADKHQEYTKMMKRAISSEQIEEVDKCVLLCSKCHSIIHAQDHRGSLILHAKMGDKELSQKFTGWFVVDHIDKSLKFISNVRNMLQPCIVKVGDKYDREHFILELVQENRLLYHWIQQIETHKRIEVRSINREQVMLEIEHELGRRVNIRMNLGGPISSIFKMDLDVYEGNSSYLWLRNGMVLTKEGEVITKGKVRFPVDLNNEQESCLTSQSR